MVVSQIILKVGQLKINSVASSNPTQARCTQFWKGNT